MSDVVYINEAEGKKRVLNNGKLYIRLLTMFKADTNMRDLMIHAESQDWEKAQISAHTLKGNAANLSLTELFTQSLEAEMQIKGKALNNETLEKLKACFDETLVQIDKVIEQNA